jgi:hypothetical protein
MSKEPGTEQHNARLLSTEQDKQEDFGKFSVKDETFLSAYNLEDFCFIKINYYCGVSIYKHED